MQVGQEKQVGVGRHSLGGWDNWVGVDKQAGCICRSDHVVKVTL